MLWKLDIHRLIMKAANKQKSIPVFILDAYKVMISPLKDP
jgi:hypothetical protein